MPSLSHNLQIRDVIDAIAQADPDLFDNKNATLMPVKHSERLTLADDLHPYYQPLTQNSPPTERQTG